MPDAFAYDSELRFDPDTVRPLGARILVRKYTRPEKVGSLFIPETAQHDDTNSLWEVVKWTPKALDIVNALTARVLEEDDIIQTRPWRGEQLPPNVDPSGKHFLIDAHEVINLIQW